MILVAAVTVTLHHTVVWALIPSSVFNYDASIWVVAVHASFVVVESVAACFIARSFFDNVIGLEKLVAQQRTEAWPSATTTWHRARQRAGRAADGRPRPGTLSAERSAIVDRVVPGGTNEPLIEMVGARRPSFADRLELAWDMLVKDGFLPARIDPSPAAVRLELGDRILDAGVPTHRREDDESFESVCWS